MPEARVKTLSREVWETPKFEVPGLASWHGGEYGYLDFPRLPSGTYPTA